MILDGACDEYPEAAFNLKGSIEEAIEIHGGEATQSKTNFTQFSQSDKDALIKFLKSL